MSLGAITFLIFLLGKIFDWGPIGEWSWWIVFLPLLIEAAVDLLVAFAFLGFARKAMSGFGGHR